MKHIVWIFLIAVNFIAAQNIVLTPFLTPKTDVGTQHLSSFKLYQLDIQEIQQVLENTKGNIYRLQFKMPDQHFDLELYEYTLFSPNYTRNLSELNTVKKLTKRKDIRTFKGIVNGQNNSEVSMTIANGFLKLMINNQIVKYFLEPYADKDKLFDATGKLERFVFYEEKDVLPINNIRCSAVDLKNGIAAEKKQLEMMGKTSSSSAPCKTCAEVQIALAGDFTMFEKYGNSNNVEAFFVSNLADVQTVFDDEFEWELSFQLTGTWVAMDQASDPFFLSRDPNEQLNTFRQVAATLFAGSEYDVATCWSAKFDAPNVEAADQAGVCMSNKYGVATSYLPGVLTSGSYLTLQAHVLGHNFSCTHDATTSNTIMNPFLTQATSWSGPSWRSVYFYIFDNGLIGTCFPICVGSGTPEPEFSADITYGCQPVTVKFKDLSTVTTKWKWSFPGGTPDTSILKDPVIVYKVAGKYPVTLIAGNSRCSVELTKTDFIEINDVPVSNFSYGIQGNEVFFIDQSLRAREWLWKFGDGEESDQQFPFHKYERDSTWEVTLTVWNDCGTHTFKKKILVQSIPMAEFSSDTIAGCASQLIKFIDQSSNNVVSWEWDFPGGNPSFTKLKNPTVRYDLPGTYDVKLTVLSVRYSHSITKKMYITIDSVPIASFKNSIDVGKVDFTNTSRHAKSHVWIFGDNTGSTDPNPTHNYTEGNYKVLYIAINSCGSDTAETNLTIGVKPTAAFQSNTVKACVPFQVQYQNMSQFANFYKWEFPGGNPSTSNDPNPLISYNTAGFYDVRLVASNTFYSDSIAKINFIEARTKPKGSFNFSINGFKTTFKNNSNGATNYLWDFGDKKISFESEPTHDYGVEGEFTVRLISSNECGQDSITKQIAVYLIPKINFSAKALVGCVPFRVQFFDKSSVDVVEWDWQFENGMPATSKEQNPVIVFDKIGKYAVKLTVKNTNGTNELVRSQFIQVVSTVLCPEYTTTPIFEISEDLMGKKLDNRKLEKQIPVIFPNPAKDYILVHSNFTSRQENLMAIYDLSGRKLFSQVLKEKSNRIQTSQLSPGIYYLSLNDGYQTIMEKFVISD